MSASHSLSQSPNLHPDSTYKRQEALWKQLVSAEHRKSCSWGDYTQHFRFPSPVKEDECIRVVGDEGGDGVAVSYHISKESGDEDLEEVMASIAVGDDGDDDLELCKWNLKPEPLILKQTDPQPLLTSSPGISTVTGSSKTRLMNELLEIIHALSGPDPWESDGGMGPQGKPSKSNSRLLYSDPNPEDSSSDDSEMSYFSSSDSTDADITYPNMEGGRTPPRYPPPNMGIYF
uniref:ORF3 n=1 Tax=Torque teno felis virus TaxID=687384 RepID=F2W496_9VIRU|nr:ORF3 [Torque teno felis virus]